MPQAPVTHPYLDAVTLLLVEALQERLAPGVDDYLDLFADSAVLETPYAPQPPRRIAGRDEIGLFVGSLRGHVELSDMVLTGRYEAPEGTVVLEYDGVVHQPRRRLTFSQSYVAVVRTDAGRVVLFREYSDPMKAEAAEREAAAGS